MEDTAIKRAAALLAQEFGSDWLTIAQQLGTENLRQRVGKELTSFMAFPDRGNGGDSKWRGNCSPEVVSSVLRYVLDAKRYYGKDISQFTLLDPMSGSGTSKAAADRLGVKSILYDLNPAPAAGMGNWNALKMMWRILRIWYSFIRRTMTSSTIPVICGVSHIRTIYPGVKTTMIF